MKLVAMDKANGLNRKLLAMDPLNTYTRQFAYRAMPEAPPFPQSI